MIDQKKRRGDRGELAQPELDAMLARTGKWVHELWTKPSHGLKGHRVLEVEEDSGCHFALPACGQSPWRLEQAFWRRPGDWAGALCKHCLSTKRRPDVEALILATERVGVSQQPVWGLVNPTFPLHTAWEGAVQLVLRQADKSLAETRRQRSAQA